MDDIVRKKEEITIEGVCNKRAKRILVEGAPGIGKTRLACYFCTEWAEGRLLQEYELVIFVPLRCFRSSQDELSINSLMASCLRRHIHSDEEKFVEQGDNILLILEGWDELTPNLRDFFLDDLIPDYKGSMMITSRRTVSSLLFSDMDMRVEVVGFRSSEVEKYIYTHASEHSEQILTYLINFPNVRALCHIPLTLAIICDIVQTSESIQCLPPTLTELYELYLLNHFVVNLRKQSDNKMKCLQGIASLSDLPKEIKGEFKALCKLAFDTFLECSTGVQFNSNDLEKVGLPIADEYDAYGLLSVIPCHVKAGYALSYQFRHLTMQEFLSAVHLTTLDNCEKQTFLEEHRLDNRYLVVLKFFCGLTKLTDSHLRDMIVSKTNVHNNKDQVFLLHCLYETQSREICQEAAKILKYRLVLNNMQLNITDCLCLAYVISHGGQWMLRLRGCNIGLDGLKIFYTRLMDKPTSAVTSFSELE